MTFLIQIFIADFDRTLLKIVLHHDASISNLFGLQNIRDSIFYVKINGM